MATELVTFKADEKFLEDVDTTVKIAGFNSRTEFIREALRDKIEEVKLKQAMFELGKLRGKASKNEGMGRYVQTSKRGVLEKFQIIFFL